ncbi:MAG: Rrf2 family transcriptional regulator [Saccharospirillaceae bacterium]|nr:Rrf2 family transcriptional regulator [Pseudomonadales bacterium]NRB78969.1 Rrf2 family transcriptional regulator [Saccharospirillaceae bacterium]
MKLTTKGRYAVTAILDLALHETQGPTALADISTRQGISLSYLEQLFAKMRRSNLVTSIRGPGGGYKLSRAKSEITVVDIVDSVNESMNVTKCEGKGGCDHGEMCLTHELWNDLSEQINLYLRSISVQDLINRPEILSLSAKQDQRALNHVASIAISERI